MHQGGATEAFLRQFPESSPGFILFCEVTNENADAHYLSFTHYAVRVPGTGEEFHGTKRLGKERCGLFQGI
jgi:hypothetical protein